LRPFLPPLPPPQPTTYHYHQGLSTDDKAIKAALSRLRPEALLHELIGHFAGSGECDYYYYYYHYYDYDYYY